MELLCCTYFEVLFIPGTSSCDRSREGDRGPETIHELSLYRRYGESGRNSPHTAETSSPVLRPAGQAASAPLSSCDTHLSRGLMATWFATSPLGNVNLVWILEKKYSSENLSPTPDATKEKKKNSTRCSTIYRKSCCGVQHQTTLPAAAQ